MSTILAVRSMIAVISLIVTTISLSRGIQELVTFNALLQPTEAANRTKEKEETPPTYIRQHTDAGNRGLGIAMLPDFVLQYWSTGSLCNLSLHVLGMMVRFVQACMGAPRLWLFAAGCFEVVGLCLTSTLAAPSLERLAEWKKVNDEVETWVQFLPATEGRDDVTEARLRASQAKKEMNDLMESGVLEAVRDMYSVLKARVVLFILPSILCCCVTYVVAWQEEQKLASLCCSTALEIGRDCLEIGRDCFRRSG